MEVKITGSPKDIAALVLAVQERQESNAGFFLGGKNIASLLADNAD